MSKKVNQVEKLIQELRIRNNLTVSELADKMYVSRQSVHHWEKGSRRVSVDTLELLVNILEETVLIGKDGYEITEDKNMSNKKQFEVDFKDFNLEEIIKEHRTKDKKFIESTCVQFNKTLDILREQGYEININESYSPEKCYGAFCEEGTILTVSKDGNTMGIEIKKNSLAWLFNLDKFIENIEVKYGNNVGEHIKKAICYRAYYSGDGEKIFNHLMYSNLRENLLNIVPELSGYEDIVNEEILSNWEKYFIELEGEVYSNEFPLSYCLHIYLNCRNDSVLISLKNKEGETRYTNIMRGNYLILNSLEYIKNTFDKFDELFKEC